MRDELLLPETRESPHPVHQVAVVILPRNAVATDGQVVVEAVLIDAAHILHHVVDPKCRLIQGQFFGYVTDRLRHIFQPSSRLGADESQVVFVVGFFAARHLDCLQLFGNFGQRDVKHDWRLLHHNIAAHRLIAHTREPYLITTRCDAVEHELSPVVGLRAEAGSSEPNGDTRQGGVWPAAYLTGNTLSVYGARG